MVSSRGRYSTPGGESGHSTFVFVPRFSSALWYGWVGLPVSRQRGFGWEGNRCVAGTLVFALSLKIGGGFRDVLPRSSVLRASGGVRTTSRGNFPEMSA